MSKSNNLDVELELTYLAKEIPEEIYSVQPIEMLDIYVPEESDHPNLRLRKRGGKYEITKKTPIDHLDRSAQTEQTIPLTKDEFEALSKSSARTVKKNRYEVVIEGHKSEVDVFLDNLSGLVLLDFEFENETEKSSFVMPSCCLADVTQELFVAGGMLAGKSYSDIEHDLSKYNYKPLALA